MATARKQPLQTFVVDWTRNGRSQGTNHYECTDRAACETHCERLRKTFPDQGRFTSYRIRTFDEAYRLKS